MQIGPTETEITGRWLVRSGKVVGDENCERIERLTSSYLRELATDAEGWCALFEDPFDKSLWERTFPRTDLQGGGPPQLRRVSATEAMKKYSWSPTEIVND
jgi:hypothetical protein